MFGVLILALLLAVFTEMKNDLKFEQELFVAEDVNENSVSDIERRDSIRGDLRLQSLP